MPVQYPTGPPQPVDFQTRPTIEGHSDFVLRNTGPYKRWAAALGNREFSPAVVAVVGDSITANGFASSAINGYAYKFSDALQRPYRASGSHWWSVGAYLGPWVNTGGTFTELYGVGGWSYINSGQTQYQEATFYCDRFHLYFAGAVGGSRTAEVLIDGTQVATVNTVVTGSTTTPVKYDSGALAPGLHTIRVRASTSHTVIFSGAYVWNGDYGKGIQVWPMGHSGHSAADWDAYGIDSDVYEAFGPAFVNPALVIIELGLNDLADGVTKAAYKTSIASVINKITTNTVPAPSLCFLSMWARGDGSYTDAQFKPYRTANKELADQFDAGFVDMYDLGGWMGTTGTMTVDDAQVTNASATINSTSDAFFRPGFDEGMGVASLAGGGGGTIPGGTTISSITASQTVNATMSANATATTSPANTGIVQFTNRKDPNLLTTDGVHPSDRGHQWLADRLSLEFGGLPRLASIPLGAFDRVGQMIVASGPDAAKYPPGILRKVTADTASGTTAGVMVDITEMAFYISANETLSFMFNLIWTTAATTSGILFDFNPAAGVSAPADLVMAAISPTGASAFTQIGRVDAAWGTDLTTTGGIGTAVPNITQIVGQVTAGAIGGLITPRFAPEANAATTLQRGSWALIL